MVSTPIEEVLIKDGLITELNYNIRQRATCPDCYQTLEWESHNSGNLGFQSWVSYCGCRGKGHSGLWRLDIETVKLSRI